MNARLHLLSPQACPSPPLPSSLPVLPLRPLLLKPKIFVCFLFRFPLFCSVLLKVCVNCLFLNEYYFKSLLLKKSMIESFHNIHNDLLICQNCKSRFFLNFLSMCTALHPLWVQSFRRSYWLCARLCGAHSGAYRDSQARLCLQGTRACSIIETWGHQGAEHCL